MYLEKFENRRHNNLLQASEVSRFGPQEDMDRRENLIWDHQRKSHFPLLILDCYFRDQEELAASFMQGRGTSL